MFALHPQLAADSQEIERWALSRVLLMNDANWPWLLLVPARPDIREIHDLAPADRALLLDEIVRASQALEAVAKPDKINVAALGNMVPQLHVHVIARYRSDVAWPKPVWGAAPRKAYAPAALDALVADLRTALASR